MPFQFMCPQGHLLEGHESQMGQQVHCPLCGTLMIVPVIGAPPGTTAAPPEYVPPPHLAPFNAAVEPPPPLVEAPFPVVQEIAAAEAPAEPGPVEKAAPKTVRILCPNGHELHTPLEMIGVQAACPECKAEFLLRYEDSLEYIEEKRAARERREAAFNRAALKWAIAAAVIVFIALVTMMILASIR
jgi:hypothetical protein